jgi:gamma-glutamylcyclotransferase (GGCT)/AIG2-like uncharacterized protein YtfP
MAHAFTYGSLMWADIMGRVCGRAFSALPASLADHVRHPVQGQDYPGMRPQAGASVQGRLYLDLDEAALARLDAFEGEEYQRSEVRVQLPDGRSLLAWTYLYKPEFSARLGAGDWDEAGFAREGKARFEARYVGFDQLGER